jgi:hypothetical protein
MNEQFLNLAGLRENPFHVSPNPRFYYSTPAHDTALAELMYGIETRRGLLVLTGEAGTGKTSILNQILDWLRLRGRSTAFIFHTRVEPIGLLRLILADFGLPCESTAVAGSAAANHVSFAAVGTHGETDGRVHCATSGSGWLRRHIRLSPGGGPEHLCDFPGDSASRQPALRECTDLCLRGAVPGHLTGDDPAHWHGL